MKKIICTLLCLVLLCSAALPVLADSFPVPFTADSRPEVGGTLTVDRYAMMDSGNVSSEAYNSLLEGHVLYSWYKNGALTQEGTADGDGHIYRVTENDRGCVLYVKLSFYADGSYQESQKWAEAVSEKVTIPGPAPQITTQSLPGATVGQAYYVKLECADPDAVFSEIMGSQLAEFGLNLTQHGEIEGTPSKEGNCHVNIKTVSESGAEDSTSFDMTVSAAPAVTEPQETTEATAATTEATVPPTTSEKETEPVPNTTVPPVTTVGALETPAATLPWWAILLIGIVCAGAGVGITIVLVKKKA